MPHPFKTCARHSKPIFDHSKSQTDARKQKCVNELRAKLRAKRRAELEALVRTHEEKKT